MSSSSMCVSEDKNTRLTHYMRGNVFLSSRMIDFLEGTNNLTDLFYSVSDFSICTRSLTLAGSISHSLSLSLSLSSLLLLSVQSSSCSNEAEQ